MSISEKKVYKMSESDKQNSESVKAAFKRNSSLIVDNLDSEFRKAIASQKLTSNLITTDKGAVVKKFAPRVANNYTVDRVFDVPHNPFRNRLAVETPQNEVELYQRFRYYYSREPLVGTAIRLHATFPLSTFELKHEDATLREEFNDIAEDLNLFEFLLDMAMEYYITGNAFPFGIFDDDKDPSVWKSFILLNPLNIEISHTDITDGRPNTTMRLKLSEAITTVIANGPKHAQTGELYNRIPADIKAAAKKDGYINLNPMQVSHFKRKANYFKIRGESILMGILHLLSYRDKLRDSQYSILDRHASPRELWTAGETGSPATDDELQALAEMVANSFNDVNNCIIANHTVKFQNATVGDNKILPIRQELDQIEEEMLIGLELNKGFLDSSYGAYANMSVALDVLINKYIMFRQMIERWMKDCVWGPLCKIHNIYKPTQAELAHKIRIKGKEKRPWVPDVMWSKHELRDPTQRVRLMMELRKGLGTPGNPGFPAELIYQAINEQPKTIKRLIEKEVNETKINQGLGTKLKAPGGGGAPGGLPDMSVDLDTLGGGSPGGGEIPDVGGQELGGGEIPNPATTDLGEGVPVQPPESTSIENETSSTGLK